MNAVSLRFQRVFEGISMRVFIWAAIAIVAIGSFCSLLSQFFWAFDLANHLRPQALIVSLIVLTVAAFFGHRLLLAGLVVLVGNAVLFAVPFVHSVGIASANTSPADKTVRVLAANVLTANQAHDRLLDLIEETQPDIVLLTETNHRWTAALRPLEDHYPYSLLHPRRDNFGMAVYAKHPFEEKILQSPLAGLPMAVLKFDGFTVYNVHPLPPVGEQALRMNKAYLMALSQNVASAGGPVIVAGDLNTTIWGDAMKPLLEAGLRPMGRYGLPYTWPAGNPLLRMQIDHIMGRGVQASTFQTLPSIGSDHFPIMADVVLQ